MSYELQTIESSKNKEVLTKKAKEVSFPLNQDMKALVAEMKKRVLAFGGVGLAAPQINQPWQVIAVYISDEAAALRKSAEPLGVTLLFNPSYEALDEAGVETDWEGCFSVEKTTGKVPRYNKILIKGQNEAGDPVSFEATGFTARVFQHEIDHINGLLITDRLTPETIHGHPKDMAKMRIQEMNAAQKAAMKKVILEALEKGNDKERYEDLLKLLD